MVRYDSYIDNTEPQMLTSLIDFFRAIWTLLDEDPDEEHLE